jgi:hypothetical protein
MVTQRGGGGPAGPALPRGVARPGVLRSGPFAACRPPVTLQLETHEFGFNIARGGLRLMF